MNAYPMPKWSLDEVLRDLPQTPLHEMTAEDRAEEAEERREEYIADFSPPIAEKLLASEDFAWAVLVDLSYDAARSVLQDVGRFFERYHALDYDDIQGAMVIARDLYNDLLPTLQAAADEQAREQVAAEYDRSEAA